MTFIEVCNHLINLDKVISIGLWSDNKMKYFVFVYNQSKVPIELFTGTEEECLEVLDDIKVKILIKGLRVL